MVREALSTQQAETIKAHSKKIIKNQRRIAELDKMFHSMYEDKVKGVISEERFVQMSKSCEQEQVELQQQNITFQAEVDNFKEDSERVDNFLALVQKYTRLENLTPDDLTATMLYEFVDKVIIHEAVWSEATATQKRKGTRSQRIEVYLKYIGNFDVPDVRSLEIIQAEQKEQEKLERVRGYKRKYAHRKQAEKEALRTATNL